MQPFLTIDEEQAVVDQIRTAELRTSGEIRVVITSRWVFRPEHHAWKAFHRLGVGRTRNRNGALIVLFVRRRRFVVLGDSGLAGVVAPEYWQGIAGTVTELLREGHKVDALASAIRTLGETMAAHWPPVDGNPDELPNAIHHE
jgi:uncharacterized membrane protein